MATGQNFLRVTDKKLLSFTDFQLGLVEAHRNSLRSVTRNQWDVDGVFNTKYTITSPAVDQVQINGSEQATDGVGNILDPGQALVGEGDPLPFENALGVVYHIALGFVDSPVGIQINPRTGKPEYQNDKEEIGRSSSPDAIVDNGGTITFTVDSVCEAGVTNAGRLARVFMLLPADGATTEAIAIEDVVVTFSAGSNRITTSGTLGQSTVSLATADYRVILLGPAIARNSNLETATGYCFIGTILGTGAGTSPTVFDTTLQRLLTTFTSGALISIVPTGWIGATDAQAAFAEIVTDLGSNGSGTSGGSLIGIDPTTFARRDPLNPPSASDGAGIGDETVIGAAPSTQAVFEAINAVLKNRKGWTATLSASASVPADVVATAALERMKTENITAAGVGGSYFLQRGNYTLDTIGTVLDGGYHVHGEVGSPSDEKLYARVEISAANQTREMNGSWARVYFRSVSTQTGTTGAGQFRFGGSPSVGFTAGFHLDQCGIASGHAKLSAGYLMPFSVRNTVIRDQSPLTTPGGAQIRDGLSIEGGGTKRYPHGILENIWVEGPPTNATTPGAALAIANTGAASAFYDDTSNCLTIRNGVFKSTRAGSNALKLTANTGANLVFENCVFKAFDSNTEPVIVSTSDLQVTFNDCTVYVSGGHGVHLAGNVSISNMKILDGGTFAPAVTSPQLFSVKSDTNGPGVIIDGLFIAVDDGSLSSSSIDPIVYFGDSLSTQTAQGNMQISNVKIKVNKTTGNLAKDSLVAVMSSTNATEQTSIDGLHVDCGGLDKATGGTGIWGDHIVEFKGGSIGNLNISNLSLVGINIQEGDNTGSGSAALYTDHVSGTGWRIDATGQTKVGTPKQDQLWLMDSDCKITNGFLTTDVNVAGFQLGVVHASGPNNTLTNFRTEAYINAEGPVTAALYRFIGDFNSLIGGFHERANPKAYLVRMEGVGSRVEGAHLFTQPGSAEPFIAGFSGAVNSTVEGCLINGTNTGVEVTLIGDGCSIVGNIFRQPNAAIGGIATATGANSVVANNVVQD